MTSNVISKDATPLCTARADQYRHFMFGSGFDGFPKLVVIGVHSLFRSRRSGDRGRPSELRPETLLFGRKQLIFKVHSLARPPSREVELTLVPELLLCRLSTGHAAVKNISTS
jgi:hypothetical protein